jgi:hypothetical protein
MADPQPQRPPPPVIGEPNDGNVAIFRVMPNGSIMLTAGTAISINMAGNVIITVGTVDPHVVNALWSNSGVLTLSAS